MNIRRWQLNPQWFAEGLFVLWVFSLPWQTRWIIESGELNGDPSEFQTIALYGPQLILLLCWCFTGLAAYHKKPRPFYSSSLSTLVVALLLVAFISAYWSADVRLSLFRFLSFGLAASSVFLVPLLRPRLSLLAFAFFLAAVLQSSLAALQFTQGMVPANTWLGLAAHSASTLGDAVIESDTGRFLRAYGSFPHPNLLGGFLAIASFTTPVLWSHTKRHWERAAVLAGSGMIGLGLLLSFSRGAWLAMLLTLLVLLWLNLPHPAFRPTIKKLTPIGMIVGVALLLGLLLAPLTLSRLQAQGRIERLSTSARTNQFQDAWSLSQESFLQGTGLGAMPTALQKIQPERSGYTLQPLHVVPLLVFVELGLFGGILFLALLVWMLRAAWQALSGPAIHSHLLMGSGMIFVIFFLLLTDHYLWTLWSGQALFWLIIGIFLASRSQNKSL